MSAAIVSSFHHDYRDLYKGLQSHRAASDIRHQVSALERLSSYAAASPLFNIPVQSQTSSTSALSNLSSLAAVKPPVKQHAPLTSSNSVANCSASHIKSASASSKEHRKLDRSVSEPADRSQSNLRPAPPNSSRYKTELCRPFEESGACKYGDKCQFAHGAHELRTLTRHPKYKTELCRTFHTTGLCPYGPRCHFIHNSEDVKKSLLTTLQTGSSPPSASPPKRLSPPPTVANLDFSSFSLGSAGELSPPMSSTSSGSPTSAAGGFLFDDLPFSGVSQVPQSAPPAVTNGFFYGQEFTALSSLSSLVPSSDYYTPPHQQGFETTEDSMINLLASELDNMSCLDRGDGPKADSTTSKTEQNLSVDVNRNLRLPIFSKLAHGSSPQ